MKRYNKYKPSGIEWLGDIPEHWEVALLTKNLFSLVDYRGKTPRKLENDETGMLLVTARNIKGGKIDYSLSEEYVDVLEAKKLLLRGSLNIGDVLFTTEAPLGEVANVDRLDIALAQRIIKFSGIKSKLDNYYLKYWLYSISFQSILKTYATGSTVEGIKGSKLRLLNILLPYLSEQTAIANYLDTKTAAIDRKIELLTAKADKYKALRRSMINETVCRGLNPNAPLKDSGIDWIGKIPEHWEVKRLKSLGNIETSSVDKKIIEDESIVKLVNYTDVYGNITKEIWNSDNYMIVSANDKQLKSKKLRQGNVLFTPSSETITDIGVSAVIMEDLENTLYSYHVLRFVFRENVDLLFKKYLLNNDFIQYYFSKSATGTTRKILGLNTFWNLPIILPPLNEQILIGKYLNENTALIDTILTNISNQISKLTQLRKTLINDVVTGKIKVTE